MEREKKPDVLEWIISVLAIGLALFNLYAMFGTPIAVWIHYPINLMLACVLAALLQLKKHRGLVPIILVLLMIAASVVSNLYFALYYPDIVWRPAMLLPSDIVCGILAVVTTLVAAKLLTGWSLPVVASVFLLYVFFGHLLPGYFGHVGYSLNKITYNLYGQIGLFGSPLAIASTFVFLFCLFGAFMEEFYVGQVFIDLATGAAGRYRGGPAKVAILASGLFGSISGSAIANVVGTGAFTIPLMKKTGYPGHFAAAVEATASTGGQIMPPVMGSTAFLLCEIVGVAYATLAIKAFVPALLFYLSVFVMVDLEAVKLGLRGLPKEELPSVPGVLRRKWPMLLPLVVLMIMLLGVKSSPSRAAVFSIGATILAPLLVRDKITLRQLLRALKRGTMSCISIITSCATAGIVVAVLSLTGLGLKIGNLLIALSGGSFLPMLMCTMVFSIILGMGLPTPAAYVICASVVAAPLTQAGIPVLAAHMFVFYFAIMAVITPPVALASYTAAGIAGANANRVGFTAVKLGILAFIVPYMFVYGQALLLEGTAAEIIISICTAIFGVVVMGHGLQAWLNGPLCWWKRLVLVAAALLTIYQGIYTDLVGLALFLVVFLLQRRPREMQAQG